MTPMFPTRAKFLATLVGLFAPLVTLVAQACPAYMIPCTPTTTYHTVPQYTVVNPAPVYTQPVYQPVVPSSKYNDYEYIRIKQDIKVKRKNRGSSYGGYGAPVSAAPVAPVYTAPVAPARPVYVTPAPVVSQPTYIPGSGVYTHADTGYGNYGKVSGSAGFFGDPEMGLFTPAHLLGIGVVPQSLKALHVGHHHRAHLDKTPLLVDPDGLTIYGKSTHVSPGRFALGAVELVMRNVGHLTFYNSGTVTLNGAPIGTLAGGIRPSFSNVNVGPHGFYVEYAGYQIAGSLRHPGGANPYYDLKVAELESFPHAADNADSPFKVQAPNGQFLGLADLLKIEPGSPLLGLR